MDVKVLISGETFEVFGKAQTERKSICVKDLIPL